MVYHSHLPPVEIPEVPLTDFVFEHALDEPDTPAIINGETGYVLTYRALVGSVAAWSTALGALGVATGTVCAIYAPNSPEYAVVFYAIAKVGGIVTTVNPLYTVSELTHQLRDSNATVLIAAPHLMHTASEAATLAGVRDVLALSPLDDVVTPTMVRKPCGSMAESRMVSYVWPP